MAKTTDVTQELADIWDEIDRLSSENAYLRQELEELDAYVENMEFNLDNQEQIIFQLDEEVEDIVNVINSDVEDNV